MHYFSIAYLCNSNLFLTSPPGLFSFIFVSVLVLYIREVQFILTRFKLGLSSWRQKRLPQDHHGASSYFNCFKRKWANPGLFLFIFVLFKHIFTEKTVRLQQDSNFDRRSRRRACWPLDHHPGPPILFVCDCRTPTQTHIEDHTKQILYQFWFLCDCKTLVLVMRINDRPHHCLVLIIVTEILISSAAALSFSFRSRRPKWWAEK